MNPQFSINVTVHDKDFLIEKVLTNIFKYTTGDYELIIVLDGCTDNSETVVKETLSKFPEIKQQLLYAPDVFETKSNNIAAKSSNGEYIIIVQDDMVVQEQGWNQRMLKPVLSFSDVFAVTARTAHNWILNPNSRDRNEGTIDSRWSDILIHTDHTERVRGLSRDTFAIRDSVNRGPLLIKHDVLKHFNYLDEAYSPQDLDEHDLCFKAYNQLGLVCGCYWIDYISDHAWGGTRPDGVNPASWVLKSFHESAKVFAERHENQMSQPKHNEERTLNDE